MNSHEWKQAIDEMHAGGVITKRQASALSKAVTKHEETRLASAISFLTSFLAAGPASRPEIIGAAFELDIPARDVDHAKRFLGITHDRVIGPGLEDTFVWSLPGGSLLRSRGRMARGKVTVLDGRGAA